MPTPFWWKQYYAAERASLGEQHLISLVESAPRTTLPDRGALIFPHTRLAISGHLTAAVARAVVESGRDTVLAIGVLHGVARTSELRGIHGPGAPGGQDIWRDEFSLDNFEAMLEITARVYAKPKPRLIARYPFQSGVKPLLLPGYDELEEIMADGAALVATADMIHHGAGYNTPFGEQLQVGVEAYQWADGVIRRMILLLANHDYAGFLARSETARSDFRDGGPVVAALLGGQELCCALHDLVLVDYSDVLDAPTPTWVAAALGEIRLSV